MISPEIRAQIRRYFYAEHWKVGTIASELGVHPETVRCVFKTKAPIRSYRVGIQHRCYADRNCAPKTVERYHQLAAYVLPHIGTTKLQDLSALSLERVFNRLKDAGGWSRKVKAPRPLSAKTVRHIAGLVHVALDTAIRWKLIKVNPVDGVQLPKLVKREAIVLEPAQLTTFVESARAEGLYEFIVVDSATGCRRGGCGCRRV